MNISQEERKVAPLNNEGSLNKVCGYGYLSMIKEALREEVGSKCSSGKLKKAVVARKTLGVKYLNSN